MPPPAPVPSPAIAALNALRADLMVRWTEVAALDDEAVDDEYRAITAIVDRHIAAAGAPPAADPLRSRVAFEVTTGDARDEALRGRVAFEVTDGPLPATARCTVRIPKDAADYRTGRAIVYQLAAKVEMQGLRPTWAATVTVDMPHGWDDAASASASGARGTVILAIDGDLVAARKTARQHLHTAAAAVLPEIKVVI